MGGVFCSVNQLPPFWQAVSKANPILYMVDGFRYGFFGVSSVSPVWSAPPPGRRLQPSWPGTCTSSAMGRA
jgi:hypothetical protein